MGINELISQKKEQILDIASMYGASNVRVFGSIARGTADKDSDIDFLVNIEPGRSLFDLGGLLMDLQKELEASLAKAEAAGDTMAAQQIMSIIRDTRPVNRKEVKKLIDERLSEIGL